MVSSGSSHADPHLIVTVYVDKRTVVTRVNHAIIFVLHGSHSIGQKGFLKLVFVLLEIPVDDEGEEGVSSGSRRRKISAI